MDLTSSPDDFPRSCSEQEKILTELQTLVTNFKLSHQKYATLLASVEGDRGMIKKHTLFLYLILHVVGCSKDPSQILVGADIDKKAAVKYDYTRSKLDNFDPTVRLEVLDGANAQIVVPTFYLKRRSSNFTRILRCKKEYKLTSSTGVEIDNLNPATKYEDMKWIWNSAAGETSQCRFVGTHVRRDKVQDIAAESGSYYYLINPCVSKENQSEALRDAQMIYTRPIQLNINHYLVGLLQARHLSLVNLRLR